METGPLRRMSTLGDGGIEVNWVRVGERATMRDKALRDIKLSPDWVVAVIQHGERVTVPAANDVIHAGDTLLVIGHAGKQARLKKLFAAG